MAIETAVSRWCLRVVLPLCALLIIGGFTPVAADEPSMGTGVVTGEDEPEPDTGDDGEDEGSQLPPEEGDPADPPGGIVGDPPPTGEPGSGGGRDNEAVAPGMVVVVLYTGDGDMTAERTTVCVGSICQPAGSQASGTKLVFDRVESGWHDVTVRSGAPYGDAASSVDVQSGQQSYLELTLVPAQAVADGKDEPTPVPVSATGPLRTAPQLQQVTTSPGWNGGVTSLPATGSGSPQPGLAWLPVVVLGAGVASLLGARWVRTPREREPANVQW